MKNERILGLNRQQLYWSCQLGGWMLFVFLQAAFLSLKNQFTAEAGAILFLIFIAGIVFTQALRFVIIRSKWLEKTLFVTMPMALLFSIVLGGLTAVIKGSAEQALLNGNSPIRTERLLTDATNFSIFYFFWSILYFLVHFIENYKRAEIDKLKWEAAISEAELNKLKSQLNPHFMFNAMNSIRALVGEDPVKAKEAVTQFSNLMRNTLQMGKQTFTPLSQEMEVVKDYLAIESIRLEERLRLDIGNYEHCSSFELPPLMIQTLVENGIKHGIAKRPQGGMLSMKFECSGEILKVIITNDGNYDPSLKPESGYGLKNTRERLQLLFGNSASFSIRQSGDTVISELIIPKKHDK
jgi:sensor histidine kinase YesM